MHSRMFGEPIPRVVDNGAGADLLRRGAALDESRVVIVGNKTNLLALGLVRVGEAQLARTGANFSLGDAAERKKCARKLGLPEGEKKIRLILGVVGGAQQMEAAVGAVFNSSVMSG